MGVVRTGYRCESPDIERTAPVIAGVRKAQAMHPPSGDMTAPVYKPGCFL